MKIKELFLKVWEYRKRKQDREFHALFGYSLVLSFSALMIAINLWSFLVCFSDQYPELAETLHIKTAEVEFNSAQVYTYVCGMNTMGGCDSERVKYEGKKALESYGK